MEPLNVLSLGAGVQSTCVLLMSCVGELPKLDAAIFADTGWEPKAVYEHLAWLVPFAAEHGIPVHRVQKGNIRSDSVTNQASRNRTPGRAGRWASMPLFVASPTKRGQVNRQCTSEYKIEPIEAFINASKVTPTAGPARRRCLGRREMNETLPFRRPTQANLPAVRLEIAAKTCDEIADWARRQNWSGDESFRKMVSHKLRAFKPSKKKF